MKKYYIILFFVLLTVTDASGQQLPVLEQLKADPRKAYGNDYPYHLTHESLTKAPKGYKPFYISHYARHGSRYYWSNKLYRELDTLLTVAHDKKLLTLAGEEFYDRYMAAKNELMTCATELTELGWQQHQGIARIMYDNFSEIFKKGGNVLAISSLSGRCMLSMSAFCQELVQCNPRIEIREQSSCFTLDAVVPDDSRNPIKHDYPRDIKPRYEKNRKMFHEHAVLRNNILKRMFLSTDGLPGRTHHITSNLINFYTSLPSIGKEGMMGNIINDEEYMREWEGRNLDSYSWVFGPQFWTIPILQDIINKANSVINGSCDHIADFRFGHDSYIGPLTVLMGINGADLDPEDPYEVKNCYQNWETCKACNIQLILYRSKKQNSEILVKCLLNGKEASLPLPADKYPYYKWNDFVKVYTERCKR